jgi:hypothetical protein
LGGLGLQSNFIKILKRRLGLNQASLYLYSMKLILTTLSLIISSYCFSQCVYITDNKFLANYKIYITDNEWQADWVVFNVNSWHESKRTRGWWYVTKNQYQADFIVYITDNKWEADRLVFVTKNRWRVKMGL